MSLQYDLGGGQTNFLSLMIIDNVYTTLPNAPFSKPTDPRVELTNPYKRD